MIQPEKDNRPKVNRGGIRKAAFAIALLICIQSFADEPSIRWPSKSTKAPASNYIDMLKVDAWLVVESSEELIVRRYPDGKIAVVEATTRGGDRLYLLRGVSPGIVCVDLIPVGVTAETDIARHVVSVVDGTQPNPPPKPEPGPEPPKPEPQPTAKKLSIAIVDDLLNLSPEVAGTLNGLATWNELQDVGHSYRIYDRATKETRGKIAVDTLGVDVSGIVIRDRATSKVVHHGPIPQSFAELKALVGRLTGA